MIKKFFRYAFWAASWLMAVDVGLTIFMAGMALFASRTYWELHFVLGWFSHLVLLFLLAFAILGRLPKDMRGAFAAMAALDAVQPFLTWLRRDVSVIAALHPIVAALLLTYAWKNARNAGRLIQGEETETAAVP